MNDITTTVGGNLVEDPELRESRDDPALICTSGSPADAVPYGGPK